MSGVEYTSLLNSIDKNDLNRILRKMSASGVSISGFANLDKAPTLKIVSELKNNNKFAKIVLLEICDLYGTVDEVEKIKNGEIELNDIKKMMTKENKVGLVAATMLGQPYSSKEAIKLLDMRIENEVSEKKLEEEVYSFNGKDSETELMIKGKASYICEIQCKHDEYFFIKPIFCIEKNKLVDVSNSSAFGSTGKIKISAPDRLKGLNLPYSTFYIFDIDIEDIYMPPIDESGEIKAQIYENKIFNSKSIMDNKNVFEIIKLEDSIDINEFKLRKERVIRNTYNPISKKIYIENKGYLYGGFGWKQVEGGLELCILGTSQFVNQYKIDELNEYIYTIVSEDFYEEKRKVIYDNELNVKQSEFDFIDNNSLRDMIAKELSSSRSDKTKIRNLMLDLENSKFSDERKQRAIDIFKNLELKDETIDDIISNILDDENKSNRIVDKIIKNPNYIKKLDKINEQLEEKKNELKEIEINIQQITESQIEDKINEKTDEIHKIESIIKDRENEKEKIDRDIEELLKVKSTAVQFKELQEKVEKARDQFKFYTQEIANVENELNTKIKEQIENVNYKALNGMIASKMIDAVNEFERENNNNKDITILSRDIINEDTNIGVYKFEKAVDIIDYIHKYISEKLNRTCFSKNDIANILLCISQGFLTVFAGPPGTGKTSLCDILGKLLGLSRSDKYNRYIEVSVEKGWTSKRDFIGYYNPLTKKFDKVDKELFKAFETLDYEKKNEIEDFPYFILLDEANLSPMEHYWADFMNVCDFDKVRRTINLSEDFKFNVSNTLRFLATINYDHTTEILSPRLIDRAWIIMLNSDTENVEYMSDYIIDEDVPMFPFEYFIRFFGANKILEKNNSYDELNDELLIKFNEIYCLFKEANVSVSSRVLKMIKKYCVVGKDVFDDSDNIYVSLDYAIAQKLLPLINGYGETYRDFLKQLQEKCDKSSMPKCNDIIKAIIKNGDKNMQYYQFFIR